MSRPLFSFGTSRGGTTFFARILSVNPQVKMASDPFLPLFRALRTAIIQQKIDPAFNGNKPLDDYYFSTQKQKTFKVIQAADLDLPFPQENLPGLQQLLLARMNLAAKELAVSANEISGTTFRELFQSGLAVMEKVYDAGQTKWCGSNDNWVIEFLPMLARAFVEAKFIVIVRDPRAAMASSMKIRDKFPTLVPLMYSFAHHWRKHAAFAWALQHEPEFQNRLLVLRYEDLVTSPEAQVKNICQFLEVEYFPAMLVPENFRPITGEKWNGYSRYEVPKDKIYTDAIDAWKKYLAPGTIEFIEFVCDPEMRLFGYESAQGQAGNNNGFPSAGVMQFLLEDDKLAQGWRGEHESWDKEFGYELFRKQMLKLNKDQLTEDVVARYFLFEKVFDACCQLQTQMEEVCR